MPLLRKICVLALLAGAFIGGGLFAAPNDAAPIQPIEFSHRVHAGDNQIACLYCHSAADRSTAAGVPAVSTCYQCHRLVKLKSPEINKMVEHWESKQPIQWVRVYNLPDYVYFSHKRHVRAGVACQSCHGEVEKAERISQASPMTMGWCVNCHKQRGAALECITCHK